jgi:hypothetical protein
MIKKFATLIGVLAVLLALSTPVTAQPAGFCTITESCINNVTTVCSAITGCSGIPPNLLPLTNTWTNTNTFDDDMFLDADSTSGSFHIGEDDDVWLSYDGTFDMATFSTGQSVGTYFAAFSPTAASTNYGGAAFFSPFTSNDSASAFVIAPDLNASTNTMDGDDTWKIVEIDPGDHSDQDHTGTDNLVIGESIESVISPDADAEYHAQLVGTGWDYHQVTTVLATGPAAPSTNQVGFFIDEAVDRGAGTGTPDCALIAKLQDATEVVVVVLATDAGCP